MRKRLWIGLTLVAVIFGSAYAVFQQEEEMLPIGSEAPNFKLTALDGKEVELSKLRGKPVYLDFWATWCGPCRAALPHTQQMAKKYGEDAHILTINLRESEERVRAFMQRNNYDFTVLMDTDGAVAKAYRVNGIPTFVVIDAQGKIQFVQVGYTPAIGRKLEAELRKAIRASKGEEWTMHR